MVAESLLAGIAAWLATYAVHSTVILLAAFGTALLLARLACRSARLRDALPGIRERLWKTALVGGIATASVQLALGIDPFDRRPAIVESAAPAIVEASATPVVRATNLPLELESASDATLLARVENLRAEIERAPTVTAPRAIEVAASAPLATPSLTETRVIQPARAGLPAWMRWLLYAWIAGVVIGTTRWLLQWNHLLRMLDDRRPIESGRARAVFDSLVARSGARRVDLVEAPSLPAPVTLGLVRRTVCIPPRAAEELADAELEALLAHEVAHARRFDPTWIALCRLLEVVLFFQPLNRAAARWLEDEAEFLCDDQAVVWTGDRLPLASCLTEIASWIVTPVTPRLAPAMAAPGVRLGQRVLRLVDDSRTPDGGARRPLVTFLALGSAALVALYVPGVAGQRDRATLPLGVRLELAAATPPSVHAPVVEPAPPECDENAACTEPTDDEPNELAADGDSSADAPLDDSTSDGATSDGATSDEPTSEETTSAAPSVLALSSTLESDAAASSTVDPFDDVLAQLSIELDSMRAELAHRRHDGELEQRIAALDVRIRDLGARFHAAQRALALQALPAPWPPSAGASTPSTIEALRERE